MELNTNNTKIVIRDNDIEFEINPEDYDVYTVYLDINEIDKVIENLQKAKILLEHKQMNKLLLDLNNKYMTEKLTINQLKQEIEELKNV